MMNKSTPGPYTRTAPEQHEVIGEALEFLDNGTPIHPGSLLHDELRRVFDRAGRDR